MREVYKLKLPNTAEAKAFWKTIKQAAAEARKIPEWQRSLPPPPIPIMQVDTFEPTLQTLRERIAKKETQRAALNEKLSKLWDEESKLIKELQNKCTHDCCLEEKTSYRDEYDDWHDGNVRRKCINCYLTEEATYSASHRSYEYGNRKYDKLAKSVVVELHQTIDGKEYALEPSDLKWSKV